MQLRLLPIIERRDGILSDRWRRLQTRKLFITLRPRELKFKELLRSPGIQEMKGFPYKKPCENSFPCILPLVFHRLALRTADMNFAFLFYCMTAIMWLLCGRCEGAPEFVSNVHRRLRNRPLRRGYAVDELLGEDEDMELNKRQQFDDYGHMRFGKREQFDDYGHMRFGRNHE